MLIRNLNLISIQSWTHLSASDESVCHVTFDEPSHVPKHPCISPKVQIQGLDRVSRTGTELPRPHKFSF